MNVSAEGLALLTEREGLRLKMYRDSAGLPSIGVGHLLTRAELSSGKIAGIGAWHPGLTRDQVDQLLGRDLETAKLAVERGVRVPLTQHQFDALTSFVFNVGVGELAHDGAPGSGFLGSTLRRQLNAGDYTAVPRELRRWIHSAGQVDPILAHRRASEIAQWAQA
jgi:lysozyme